jgi:hypothetical protein
VGEPLPHIFNNILTILYRFFVLRNISALFLFPDLQCTQYSNLLLCKRTHWTWVSVLLPSIKTSFPFSLPPPPPAPPLPILVYNLLTRCLPKLNCCHTLGSNFCYKILFQSTICTEVIFVMFKHNIREYLHLDKINITSYGNILSKNFSYFGPTIPRNGTIKFCKNWLARTKCTWCIDYDILILVHFNITISK